MSDLFALISLSFNDDSTVDEEALSREMSAVGLGKKLNSTEGYEVTLPRHDFACVLPPGDTMEVLRRIHRNLNSILKKLNVHGRFLVLVSPEASWSCCHF